MEYLGVGGSLLLEKLIVDWQGEFDEVLEFYPCGLRLSGLRVLFSRIFPRTWVVLFFRNFVYFCHISSPKYVTIIHLR